MKFETEEEYNLALRDFKKLYPWVDGVMAHILLTLPEEKLNEIWEKVKHEKFEKVPANEYIMTDAVATYEDETVIPAPPSTIPEEQLKEINSRIPKLVLEESVVETSD